ncbi:MAG: hypothetical protein EBR82_23015 [Caulobacteraceae bacterium]|nr:hypothetical protein [Caulobacteraceae bacterium]
MVTAPPIVQANKLTLLGLINQATGELGLPQYTQIVNNTDSQAVQLLALAKREGKEFFNMANRIGGWEELRKQYIFQTSAITGLTGNTTVGSAVVTNISSTAGIVAGRWAVSGTTLAYGTRVLSVDSSTQITMDSVAVETGTAVDLSFGQDAYTIPSDFAYFIQQTYWDRNFRWQLLGPLSAQEWQVIKSGISPTGPRRRFRVMGGYFWIDPTPTDSTSNEVFEYYSNSWCQSSTGTAQSTWAADGDYYTLDDDAFILGLKWRILAAKKLDYGQEKQDYDMLCQRLVSRNGGNRDIPINAQASGMHLINNANIPDTGFGS